VKPLGDRGDEDILVMPALTTACPGSNVAFNWVQASQAGEGGDLSGVDLWGNATLPFGGGSISGQKWTMDSGSGTTSLNAGTVAACSGGKYALSRGGRSGFVTMTQAGVGIVNTQDDTNAINLTFPGTGDATYTMLTDPFTGTTGESGPVTIVSAGEGEQNGFLKMQANAGTDATPPTMWGAVASLEGHTVIIAAGFNQGGGDSDGFTVVLVQK
jgi:hypothetical protein